MSVLTCERTQYEEHKAHLRAVSSWTAAGNRPRTTTIQTKNWLHNLCDDAHVRELFGVNLLFGGLYI